MYFVLIHFVSDVVFVPTTLPVKKKKKRNKDKKQTADPLGEPGKYVKLT